MAKVIITAQVEDTTKWEEGFRTHGDLFKSQTTTKMVFGIGGSKSSTLEGNWNRTATVTSSARSPRRSSTSPARSSSSSRINWSILKHCL